MTTATELSTLETQSFPPLLEVREMTKRFGTFTALDHVSMTLKPGTFHALLGENGAGKSTLVKCIMGFYAPNSGKVQLEGRDCSIASPRDAQKYGIGMVYQHFTSVPAMTVAENLLIARSSGDLVINWKAETEKLAAFMQTSP
ncbi:ATP-binding cassette domain-containing protein, partial [Pseudanabaenaceae cyanobacterium LEGE 13415]|nr:ATP-binding cassette domain-containing protein [Pseudanabaenaceae cyanobacterium LEGE 13415]